MLALPGIPPIGAALPAPALPKMLGGAGVPVAGVYGGMGGAHLAGKPPLDMWMDVNTNPGMSFLEFSQGDIYESITKDVATNTINGTWIFQVLDSAAADQYGRFLEVGCLGASVAPLNVQFTHLFPPKGGGTGVVHICGTPAHTCTATAPGRQPFHVDCFRRRDVQTITEPWYQAAQEVGAVPVVTPESKAVADAAKVAELRERLLREKVNNGTATIDEQIAYNLAKGLKRKQEDDVKKKKEKSKSRKKRKRDKDHSDSSSSSNTPGVFGEPLPRESAGHPLVKQAYRNPGTLYQQTSLSAAQQTGARGRGEKAAQAYAATGEQWLNYVRTVLAPKFPQGIPPDVMRELKTLACALEHFAKGEMSQLGDILAQRLKSVELTLGGEEGLAHAVQLVGLKDIGLTDYAELNRAQRFLTRESRQAGRSNI